MVREKNESITVHHRFLLWNEMPYYAWNEKNIDWNDMKNPILLPLCFLLKIWLKPGGFIKPKGLLLSPVYFHWQHKQVHKKHTVNTHR